jgi:hypothetical protein
MIQGNAAADATPAKSLEGLELPNGWVIGPLIEKAGTQTGGVFSCAYPVRKADGQSAFLKAMDYTRALRSADPAAELNTLTSAFLFEREILQECADRKISNRSNI